MRTYSDGFFEYVNSGSISSARQLLPLLSEAMPIGSVLDIGCGQGAWLSVWRELGVEDVLGVDGDYVRRDKLLIPENLFIAADLTKGLDIGRKFDLVQSLEVAEHLPSSKAGSFVEGIIAHGNLIMFSAAPKGQGGDHHINEQNYEYWRSLFRAHGYAVLDCIRPEIAGIDSIEPWYRYNTFLYVHEDRLPQLPDKFRASRIPDDRKLRDISPPLYKARKQLVRLLPVSLATRIAQAKEAFVTRARMRRG